MGGKCSFIKNGIGRTVRQKNILKELNSKKGVLAICYPHKKWEASCGVADKNKYT